jgi:hypothetical protein
VYTTNREHPTVPGDEMLMTRSATGAMLWAKGCVRQVAIVPHYRGGDGPSGRCREGKVWTIMFGLRQGSRVQRLSDAVRFALEAGDVPDDVDASTLAMVEQWGRYAGRTVTYFRVFDPAQAASRWPDVFSKLSYADLEASPRLVLFGGLVEADGTVVLTHVPAKQLATPHREPADRAAHTDDERFVFPSRSA